LQEEYSFVGEGVVRVTGEKSVRMSPRRHRKLLASAVACCVVAILGAVALVGTVENADEPARSMSVTVIPGVPLVNQFYDTPMPCLACGPGGLPQGPHVWNDAKGPDKVYGTPDDCPHCSAYCAPASISMIAIYRGFGPPFILQDNIYDNGKVANGEIPANAILETHGFGMFQGTGGWPPEVQNAMTWAVGPILQHDWVIPNPNGPMTAALLQQYIGGLTPVLWLDVGGFPASQSPTNPPPAYRMDQGHAKVIVGYDDNGSVGSTSDDLCLINDPWPEYNDLGILPANCTPGPLGSWDPYWQPLNDINLTDIADIYLVDTFAPIPEFPTMFIPVLGLVMIAVAAFRRRLR